MKIVLVLVFAVFAVASAYPRATREEAKEDDSSEDTELYIVPLRKSSVLRQPPFAFGLSEDLVPPPFEQHPFFAGGNRWGVTPAQDGQVDDFMSHMQQMLTEMRKQLTDIIHRSHTTADSLPEEGATVDTKLGTTDLPQNKSTSTTKVIDGHVVTVNETTYSSGDDNIGAVFRIKVVEVVPSESPVTEDKPIESEEKPTESEEKPTESEEKPTESEEKPSDIPSTEDMPKEPNTTEVKAPADIEPTTGKSEAKQDKHEETNEIPNGKVPYEWSSELDPSSNDIDRPEVFSVDEFSPVKKENYYDLSSDTKVNDYMSDNAESQGLVMIDPDAEMIDINPDSYYHYNRMPERLQRFP